MPEDYQAILSDLGVDTSSNPATPAAPVTPEGGTADNTPSQADNTAGTNPEDSAPASATADNADATAANPTDAGQDSDEQRRRNEAFATMRSENTKYKKFIGQIMKGANFQGTEEDFMAALEDASYRRQAQQQGNQVSPELLKRMDALENQNNVLLEERNREMFTANLRNLQDHFKLSDAELKEFVNFAVKEKIDLTIPGTNFITLYQGLFFDKLNKKMIEDARQEWITQNGKAANAANPDGKSGKKDPTPNNVNTMAEFNSLLQTLPINQNNKN